MAMDPKSITWSQSPSPTRISTPIQQNPHINLFDDQTHLPSFPGTYRRNAIQTTNLKRLHDPKVEDDSRDEPYNKDEHGEEMSEFARVWKVYNDEAAKFDSSLTDGWNRGVDVLLVFTGLFSAVLTTFIIQSFQMMIPDSGQTTNVLLQQLISLQTNSSQVVPTSSNQLPTSRQVIWVNGLWFAALACSLSTALVSMLAKQWLQAYSTNASGSPRQRARQRQSKYMELISWHVLALINSLPLLLHAALLLFFAGIVVLLWSIDRGATFATLLIVISAYTFYLASMFLPIVYPGCPYQHPISEHFRHQMLRIQTYFLAQPEMAGQFDSTDELSLPKRKEIVVREDERLDAYAVVWLLNTSTDKYVISTALQAIAGLPRDFTAMHVLRDAGVITLIEQGFQSCFDQDTTIDLEWHLKDAEVASLLCKAWMNMTRGSSMPWPFKLREPLRKLQEQDKHMDGVAIACCAFALSSITSYPAQQEQLLAYLSRYMSGDIHLSRSTVTWMLDSMIDGLTQWDMPSAVIEQTNVRAVPVLLRLLRHIEGQPTSTVRSAAGLALYIFTSRSIDLYECTSEDRRRNNYSTVMVRALAAIVANPERFGVGNLLDVAVKELSRLASPIISQWHRFSFELKETACASLFKLLVSGHIAVGLIDDADLVNVLHLLRQTQAPLAQRPDFVRVLVTILFNSSHEDVASWSVRLLRPLLTERSLAVAQAFVENNGIRAVLRAARIGDIDNRRLQVDSWRSLWAFIDSSVSLCDKLDADITAKDSIVDHIFQSDFFETVCEMVVSRRWWLLDVSGQWTSVLTKLCSLRPHEQAWNKMIKVVRETTGRGKESEGMSEIMYQLETVLDRNPNRRSRRLGETLSDSESDFTMHAVSLAEQRQALRSPTPPPVLLVRDGTSTWFEVEP
ncbi:hypothetical protein H0H92_004163 [Tricholoma furcatifolium]|nr:hypothetical protein H0H92_004163 [Tricholoma furcatifolium]